MKKTFTVTRRMCVPIEEYQNVYYEHSISISYDEQEMEENTIIDSQELKEMMETLDKEQRRVILEETGIKKLIIDKSKEKNSPGLKKLLLKKRNEYE